MTNTIPHQNLQDHLIPKNTKGDTLKKQSRRNGLRSAAIKATSAVLLFFVLTGCTKKQLDDVIGKIPGGGLGSTPNPMYILRVTFDDGKGATKVSYLSYISKDPAIWFYDYMQVGGSPMKFKLHPGPNGFNYWEMEDGNWFSIKLNGWAYRSTQYYRVGWKIVDGRLYTDYNWWQDYPLGVEFRSDLGFILGAYYVGANLSNNNVFTCEMVPAP